MSGGDATATPGTFAPAAVSSAGGSTAHENRQPYLPINFCIATVGMYPSRS